MSTARLQRVLRDLEELPTAGVIAACKAVKTIAAQEGGTVILGKRRRRVKLKARDILETSSNRQAKAVVYGVPTGPWVWLDSGRRGGYPIPKRKPTARRTRPMHAPGYPHPIQRMQIHGGAMHGRGSWRKVRERAARLVPEIFRDEVREVIRRG